MKNKNTKMYLKYIDFMLSTLHYTYIYIFMYLIKILQLYFVQENRSFMRIVKQNQFKNLGELHKEWTEAVVKASRATTHRRVKEFGYSCHQRRLTWDKLSRRRTGLLPSGPKSSFQMRESFVFRLETKVLESGGRVGKLIAQVA